MQSQQSPAPYGYRLISDAGQHSLKVPSGQREVERLETFVVQGSHHIVDYQGELTCVLPGFCLTVA